MEKNESLLPVLIEIQCFGNINFWVESARRGKVIFEQFEQFQKTGYRNRYKVLGANGIITLSIPVLGGRETRDPIKAVRIDNRSNWQKGHWRTLESCYNKSPYFFHYARGLQEWYNNEFTYLWDFNLSAFHWVEKQLKLKIEVDYTATFEKNTGSSVARDLRGLFKTSGRKQYLNEPYFQVFESDFQQNLSILDVLFNLGPQTTSYLMRQPII